MEGRDRKQVTVDVRVIEKEDEHMVNGNKSYFQLGDEQMNRVWREVLKASSSWMWLWIC